MFTIGNVVKIMKRIDSQYNMLGIIIDIDPGHFYGDEFYFVKFINGIEKVYYTNELIRIEENNMAGMKNDAGKPDLTLISSELMIMLARVREFGNKKYEKNNWKKGFKVTRSLAAALRHIFQFLDGETFDKESGISHLGHAVASLEHAIYDMQHRPENDDRQDLEKQLDEPRSGAV